MLITALANYLLIFLFGLIVIYKKEEYINLVDFNSIIFHKHDQK